MKKLAVFILICFLAVKLCGQNTIGLPDIINYSKLSYGGGLQNWDIRQDRNGIIYIANNEGLLSFDGKFWNLYPLPNRTIVRSVEIGPDNNIYTGGQDEFGYFSPGMNGRLQYTSLISLIPEKDRTFGDVWDIVSYKKDIFFRTLNKIFKLSGNSISVYYAPLEWSFLGECNGILYAHDFKSGLLSYQNNVWSPLKTNNSLPGGDPVTGILALKADSVLITMLKSGVYLLSKNIFSKKTSALLATIEKERIYAATSISPEWVALATNSGGVYIVNQQGELVQRFSKTEGLQNNNILSVFLDQQQNLWLGLDNGIDFIAYNSPIKRITPYSQDGSGYTTIIHNNQLYAGTSGGLFSVPLQKQEDLSFSVGSFRPVENTSGQTWCLAEINGQLLLGHHDGAFLVENNIARQVSSIAGFWNFTPLSSVMPAERLIAGNYKWLTFFDYRNNTFNEAGNIPGFSESCRFVAIDKNENIWISHPYHGVYKLTPSPNGAYQTKLYTYANGLPSTLNNHVYKIKNEVLVATEKGVYTYNSANDRFEPSAFYQRMLGKQSLRYLKEDTEGNIWFVHEKGLGVLDVSAKDTAVIYLSELTNKLLSGFEFIYAVDPKNIFVGAEKGFIHINYEKYKRTAPELKVQIRSVHILDQKDSLLFGGYFDNVNAEQVQAESQVQKIGNNWKTIHFDFSSTLFNQQPNLEYSYRLKELDENWSAWSSKTDKEYTHLPAGTYSFEIKVRNNLGNESRVFTYKFEILPPWYRTTWAKLLYFLIFCVTIYYFYQWQLKKFALQQAKHAEEQKRLQYLHQLEIDKAEKELVTLRNEKLQAEVDFKNSELATSAMHLVQKGELVTKLKAELQQIMKVNDHEKAVNEIKRLIKVLGDDEKMDNDWDHFIKHFDKVHSDFVVALKEKHPNITANELKLCAYLRMNLSTKEIAQLMNISVRGVEISRYRLRKKLGIPSEVNLFTYLIGINKTQ